MKITDAVSWLLIVVPLLVLLLVVTRVYEEILSLFVVIVLPFISLIFHVVGHHKQWISYRRELLSLAAFIVVWVVLFLPAGGRVA